MTKTSVSETGRSVWHCQLASLTIKVNREGTTIDTVVAAQENWDEESTGNDDVFQILRSWPVNLGSDDRSDSGKEVEDQKTSDQGKHFLVVGEGLVQESVFSASCGSHYDREDSQSDGKAEPDIEQLTIALEKYLCVFYINVYIWIDWHFWMSTTRWKVMVSECQLSRGLQFLSGDDSDRTSVWWWKRAQWHTKQE